MVARLAADARCISDGGGVKRAARRPVVGAARVARFFVNLSRRYGPAASYAMATSTAARRSSSRSTASVDLAAVFDVVDGRIASIWAVRNPDKLAHLVEAVPLS